MADIYAIEIDTRDKPGGCIMRHAMFDSYDAAKRAWQKMQPDEDPDVQFWLVKIRNGVDDPAHIDALEFKCREP